MITSFQNRHAFIMVPSKMVGGKEMHVIGKDTKTA